MDFKVIPLILALACVIVAKPQDTIDYDDGPGCSDFASYTQPELQFR